MSNLELKNAVETVQNNKTILYPTDTVWGIGCDATNEKSVAEIYKIKNREASKSLIILVDSLEMLSKYIENIPYNVKEVLATATKPTTIIYKNPIGIAKNCIAEDQTIAVRIVQNDFCQKLINQLGKPIVSTSANVSGEPTPKSFSEISKSILDSVDYIVNLQQEKITTASSRILKITDENQVEVIRD